MDVAIDRDELMDGLNWLTKTKCTFERCSFKFVFGHNNTVSFSAVPIIDAMKRTGGATGEAIVRFGRDDVQDVKFGIIEAWWTCTLDFLDGCGFGISSPWYKWVCTLKYNISIDFPDPDNCDACIEEYFTGVWNDGHITLAEISPRLSPIKLYRDERISFTKSVLDSSNLVLPDLIPIVMSYIHY
jgi:hypothetical protein